MESTYWGIIVGEHNDHTHINTYTQHTYNTHSTHTQHIHNTQTTHIELVWCMFVLESTDSHIKIYFSNNVFHVENSMVGIVHDRTYNVGNQ